MIRGLSILSGVSMFVTFGMMFAAMALIFGAPLLAGLENRKLRSTGSLARAKVLSANQTGTYINENPVVHFTLEVQPDGEPPFQADAERLVPMVRLAALQPGSEVAVRYDPQTLETAISDEALPESS